MVTKAKSKTVTASVPPRVYWKHDEEEAVVKHAAVIRLNNGGRGGYSTAVLNAQKLCLEPSRQRPEKSLLTSAAAKFSARIDREMDRLKAARAAELAPKLPTEAVEVSAIPSTKEVHYEDLALSKHTLISETKHLVEDYEETLVELLEGAAIRAIRRVNQKVKEVRKIMAEEAATDLAIQTREVSALDLITKGREVSAIREKVGYLDNGNRQKDHQLVTKDLEGVYKFVFVDSPTKKGSLLDCDVIIRSVHCGHDLYRMAKTMAPKHAVWIEDKSPNMANEMLMERFCKSDTTVSKSV